ncbi:MAG: efflux RND transporter periplasmic adaptor subunit [Betaproteobacteria bacterium]|nr:MAG: efflux RND transporter periplasmic adaptor subunit [Betaproteobacteria bacterium]
MKIKRWMWVTGAVLLLAAGGGAVAVQQMRAKAEEQKKQDEAKKKDTALSLAAVDLFRAAPATLSNTLPISGTVDAAKQAMVRSRHAGIATQISKRAGDTVRQGEVLARVDSEELRLRIGERESALRQTQAALTVAESARTQQRSLSDRGFISKAALDSAESNFISAKSAHENAQSQLSMARSALGETALTAPISGVIAKRSVEPGERVGNEMQVFQIIDPSSLEVVVAVPAERAAELKVGQKAKFQIDSASGGSLVEATLSRVIPSTGSSARTIETRFALPSNSSVPAGAFLSGKLEIAQTKAAVAIPRVAVRSDGSGSYVWAVQDGKTVRVRVKVVDLDSGGDQLSVESGIAAGADVLMLRGTEPREGQVVVMPGAKPAAPSTAGGASPAPSAAVPTKS